MELLHESKEPIIGSKLADKFNVSRQVIVQDVALLRARGENILATSQGYLLPGKEEKTVQATIACQHLEDRVEDELMSIVNQGAKVIDVSVEHPLYGELTGMLMIQNPADVEEFMKNINNSNASLLAALTDGVHLHTIEALNEMVIKRVKKVLKEKGYLLDK